MRYIPLLKQTPSEKWLKRATKAIADIEALSADRDARNKLIEKKAAIWKAQKDWLLELSDQKCWFSEAKDCFQDWDVEHYRPKKSAKDLDGNERDGYWWLSLDWKNFRICGRVGNVKKGTFFPVKGTVADENHRGLVDDWNKSRVEVSVRQYKLYYDKLELMRKDVWDTCTALMHEIQNLMLENANNPSARKTTQIEEKIETLASYTHHSKVCSSVAIACLQKSEIGWAARLSAEAN